MLFWFIATSVLTISFVFRDPRFDYRWLIGGALLPDVVDVWFGGARVLHSLVGAVGAMTLVMIITAGRRPIRRRLLSVPIGVLLHLVFDGAFSSTDVFWWPFMGGFGDADLPVVQRGWWNLALEAAGVAMIVWAWSFFGLADATRRRRFITDGTLTHEP